MALVITGSCCNDASCVSVCPVNCIHPTPDDEDFGQAEMLYIDPDTCISCGACVLVCPTEAIGGIPDVAPSVGRFDEIATRYYSAPGRRDYAPLPRAERVVREPDLTTSREVLRVAIVGAGPSAAYAAERLCERLGDGVEVNLFERLPVPWGLARFGVAPDHQSTKKIMNLFERTAQRPNVHLFLNVEVGKHLTHEDLQRHHHAIIYAVGARHEKRLGVPGEELPAVRSAFDFVGWYNGHPDKSDGYFDLSCDRAVIVGNGNVALDMARILVSGVDELATTTIAEHALEALRQSRISEVVILGRRGPAHAAYTLPELLSLTGAPGVEVVADRDEWLLEGPAGTGLDTEASSLSRLKVDLLRELGPVRASRRRGKRIVLRFGVSPVEFVGDTTVRAVRLERSPLNPHERGSTVPSSSGHGETLECGLVLRSIGFRSKPIPGLPFDAARSCVPTIHGRVIDPVTADPRTGAYATGWVKRGPSGYLGTNKHDARETVESLVTDFNAKKLASPVRDQQGLELLVRQRQPRLATYPH